MKKNVIRNTIIVVLICCVLFLGSYTFFTGRAVQKLDDKYFTYAGYEFFINEGNDLTHYYLHYPIISGWEMKEDGSFRPTYIFRDIPFRNDPKELEDVPCEIDINWIDKSIKNDEIYITQDPGLESRTDKKKSIVATGFIIKILDNRESPYIFDVTATGAYTSPKAESSWPVVTCEDASSLLKVILLREADKTGVFKEGDCIYVQGPNGDELIKAAERFVYTIIGVM